MKIILAIGRIFLTAPFIINGFTKLIDPQTAMAQLGAIGLPESGVVVGVVIAIETLGGLFVLLGFQARWAALLMGIYWLGVTFLQYPNATEFSEWNMFTLNLMVAGALFMVSHWGAGPMSLESLSKNPSAPRKKKELFQVD